MDNLVLMFDKYAVRNINHSILCVYVEYSGFRTYYLNAKTRNKFI